MTTTTLAGLDLAGLTRDDRHHAVAHLSLAAHAMRCAAGWYEPGQRRRFHNMSTACAHIAHGSCIPGEVLAALDVEQRFALDHILGEL